MPQSRVVQDDNVTIVYTKIPDGKYTEARTRDPPQEFVQVRLSEQARQFLRRQGFSERFISSLHMMLQEATNVVHNTIVRGQRTSREGYDFSVPLQPERREMPSDIRNCWTEMGEEGGRSIKIPDISSYFPTLPGYASTYHAFASAEGQRFMNRYYVTGWLRQDPATREWIVAPPAPLSQITPSRTPR